MIIVFGSKGMLGSYLVKTLSANKVKFIGLSRDDFDFSCRSKTVDFLNKNNPELIYNCAANINIDYCETHPKETEIINTIFPEIIAEWSSTHNTKVVQISTDHFYSGHEKYPHSEEYPVQVFNQYAKQKLRAEKSILSYSPENLVVRTSIIGLKKNKTSFLNWVLRTLATGEIPGFSDSFTSSIDTNTLSDIITRKKTLELKGIYNISSDEVYSKLDFISELVSQLGESVLVRPASIKSLRTKRADSCGLDNRKFKNQTNIALPNLKAVVTNLVFEINRGKG